MGNDKARVVAIIDSGASGVSGDKYLGALLALGANLATLRKVGKAVEGLLPGVEKVEISATDAERGEIGAKLVKVETQETVSIRKASVVRDAIKKTAERAGVGEWGRAFALATIDSLTRAESRVHGHSPEETVLQELGSPDTVVDILGTAMMVEELELQGADWCSTPLAVGGGTVKFSGRTYPNPPPAVLEVLRMHDFPIRREDELTELTTPTGAAITVNLAKQHVESYPSMRPMLVGYGAGSKELRDAANLLRITIGETAAETHVHDHMVILETNLDDVTGEVVGFTMEKLLAEGARDVTVTPVYMKKNRPGHLLSVITDEGNAEKMAKIIIDETGTLGVREVSVKRHISLRRETTHRVQLGSKPFKVRVKQAHDMGGRVLREKPESDDVKKVSRKTGLPYRQVSKLALAGRREGD